MPNQIFLIRHGESTFNAAVNEARKGLDPDDHETLLTRLGPLRHDSSLLDAPLSQNGHLQVAAQASNARALGVDLVLTSPLTRALQTAIGLFGTEQRFGVCALQAERLFSVCDVGRSPVELGREFPGVDFAGLAEQWWFHDDDAAELFSVEPDEQFRSRVAAFSAFLGSRTEQRLAVVGHGLFFQALCGYHPANCEIVPYVGPSTDPRP